MADVAAEGQVTGGAASDRAPQHASDAGSAPAAADAVTGAPDQSGQPGTNPPGPDDGGAGERHPGRLAGAGQRARNLVAGHWQFSIVLVVAAALRAVVMLGYPPILWFNDSYNYLEDAATKTPDVVRSDGYPLLLLFVLHFFRSLTLLAALQALMGLAMGAAIYAVLRRRGLPWWGATLAAVPVLFDVFEMQLEHMVMSDVLFIFLVTVAIVALCWFDRPPVAVCVIVGLMIGYAALVRSVGEPLLIVVAVGLLLRRVNWKRTAALLVVGVLPIAGYMIWYHSFYGQYSLDTSSGTFLYSRVSSFAECSKISLPNDLKVLCDPTPPAQRPNSQEYLWATNTPLYKLSKGNNFSPHANSLAGQFAKDAILSEPLQYARVVLDDTLHTFTWTRTQSDLTGSGPSYRFRASVDAVPWWATYYPAYKAALLRYGGPSMGQPKVVTPYSSLIQGYQKIFYLRGTMLAAIVLIGAGGIIARWRRWGGLTLVPWAVTAVLIVLPPMTAGFSYRYVTAAVPVACLAAGLALTREPRTSRKVADAQSAGESVGVAA